MSCYTGDGGTRGCEHTAIYGFEKLGGLDSVRVTVEISPDNEGKFEGLDEHCKLPKGFEVLAREANTVKKVEAYDKD